MNAATAHLSRRELERQRRRASLEEPSLGAIDAEEIDGTVDVSDWLEVKPGDWVRAELRSYVTWHCEPFQGVVESVKDDWQPSVVVNEVRRYWAMWELRERRPA